MKWTDNEETKNIPWVQQVVSIYVIYMDKSKVVDSFILGFLHHLYVWVRRN